MKWPRHQHPPPNVNGDEQHCCRQHRRRFTNRFADLISHQKFWPPHSYVEMIMQRSSHDWTFVYFCLGCYKNDYKYWDGNAAYFTLQKRRKRFQTPTWVVAALVQRDRQLYTGTLLLYCLHDQVSLQMQTRPPCSHKQPCEWMRINSEAPWKFLFQF